MFPGVKEFVDDFVKENDLKLEPIGLEKGKFIKENVQLSDSEGVIIEL